MLPPKERKGAARLSSEKLSENDSKMDSLQDQLAKSTPTAADGRRRKRLEVKSRMSADGQDAND